MPHDSKGVELKAGDRVKLEGVVKEITSTGEDYCNVSVEVQQPGDNYKPTLALNTKSCTKLD